MEKRWIQLRNRGNPEYISGVKQFIEFAANYMKRIRKVGESYKSIILQGERHLVIIGLKMYVHFYYTFYVYYCQYVT